MSAFSLFSTIRRHSADAGAPLSVSSAGYLLHLRAWHNRGTKHLPPAFAIPQRKYHDRGFLLQARLRKQSCIAFPFPPGSASGFLQHDARLCGQTPVTAATKKDQPAQVSSFPVSVSTKKPGNRSSGLYRKHPSKVYGKAHPHHACVMPRLRSSLRPSHAQKQETRRYMAAVTSHNSKVMRETAMTSRL